MATADLFPPTAPTAPDKAPCSGLLVTNHLNLMYMLAAGLVMPPAGFGGKYYRDTLGDFPGWIPLFVGKAPRAAIESATGEARHLRPSIVEVGLSSLSGQVMALREGNLRELHFPDQLDGSERAILVPAPLPTSWIVSIVFRSADDRRACESDAAEYGNVPLSDFKRRTSKALYTRAPDAPWPPGDGPPERAAPLHRPLAAGGVMAMLAQFGNLGDQAVRACRHAFDPDDESEQVADEHPIFVGLRAWAREGLACVALPGNAETDRAGLRQRSQAMLFWDAVDRLAAWREAGGAGGSEDAVIESLDAASARLGPRLQAGVGKLRDTLESLTGLPDATTSDVLERHDTPLAHAMTLFLLRRDCADLVDFRSDRLGEADWLAAAILFGVRDGWLNLPLRLRALPGLAAAVSHRMAGLAHRIAGTGIELGEPPARIRPLRELLGDGSAWRSGKKSAVLLLARTEKWDCVHTRIRLRPGEYRITVASGSTCIDLPGEPDVSPEIDVGRFLRFLAEARLDHETEARVRELLRV